VAAEKILRACVVIDTAAVSLPKVDPRAGNWIAVVADYCAGDREHWAIAVDENARAFGGTFAIEGAFDVVERFFAFFLGEKGRRNEKHQDRKCAVKWVLHGLLIVA
jgi:hypothetical protein